MDVALKTLHPDKITQGEQVRLWFCNVLFRNIAVATIYSVYAACVCCYPTEHFQISKTCTLPSCSLFSTG